MPLAVGSPWPGPGSPIPRLALALVGCDEDDGVLPERDTCVGEQAGDIQVDVGTDGALDEGGNIRIAATHLDEDPVVVDLGLGSATDAGEDSAKGLAPGDTFTLQGRTYRLVGACDDAVWVDRK